jgi:hypothetical protein
MYGRQHIFTNLCESQKFRKKKSYLTPSTIGGVTISLPQLIISCMHTLYTIHDDYFSSPVGFDGSFSLRGTMGPTYQLQCYHLLPPPLSNTPPTCGFLVVMLFTHQKFVRDVIMKNGKVLSSYRTRRVQEGF